MNRTRPVYKKETDPEKIQRIRERNREAQRKYRKANPEKVRESQRVWAAANPEKLRARNLKWRAANMESERESVRKWRKANPEKSRESIRAWRAANPEKFRAQLIRANQRRRAHKAGVPSEPWTRLEILERDGWQCQIEACRCPYGRAIDPMAEIHTQWHGTIDHIQPMSKGGSDLKDNLQAAHRACNCSKNDRWERLEESA